MMQFVGLLYLTIGFVVGIYIVISNFDKKDYIWNKKKGVEFWAVVFDLPGWLLFICFLSFGWGGIVIFVVLDWIGLIPEQCMR